MKSETSDLDQLQKNKEVKEKSQKESEPDSTLRKKERCDKNLRIQLAAEVAKSKTRVKILEAQGEVPDDAKATLKSETSYLDQLQKKQKSEREESERMRTRFYSQEKGKM